MSMKIHSGHQGGLKPMGSTEDSHHCLAFFPQPKLLLREIREAHGAVARLSPCVVDAALPPLPPIDGHNFPNVNQEPGSVPGSRV